MEHIDPTITYSRRCN